VISSVVELFEELGRDPGGLIGLEEADWLDFKKAPYQLDEEKHCFDLAKDVSAIANGDKQGVIVIGVETELIASTMNERAKALRPIADGFIEPRRIQDVIHSWVHPALDVTVRWHPLDGTDDKLWTIVVDLQRDRDRPFMVLREFVMEHYSLSPDGNRIVFAAIDEAGHSPVWLATLDGSTAPRRLAAIDATRTFFGANGDVYFLGLEDETKKFVYRVREDGSALQKALPNPVAYFYDVSPDAKSLAVLDGAIFVQVYSTDGGSPTTVCTICGAAGGENRGITPPAVSWSPDGKFLYLNLRAAAQIYAVPLQPGRNLPPLPTSGIVSLDDAAALPEARVIREERAFAGPSPSVYAVPRVTTHRNIYRITVP